MSLTNQSTDFETLTMSRRRFVALSGGMLGTALLAGCADKQTETATDDDADVEADDENPTSIEAHGIDYLVLVNKLHELPEGWEDKVDITHFENSEGWDVDVEVNAYDAYLALKEDLEAEDGVYVDLDSAYRSIEEQQRIMDDFTKDYGEEYAQQTVAVPGYSEHHTGLALDLFLIIDGKGVYYNEDMLKYPEIWEKIHARLADHAFILRYLPDKKLQTGYGYEPWHIRYVYDPSIAAKIMDAGICFEEYLGQVEPCVDGAEVDYGSSDIFIEGNMNAAIDVVLNEFRTWDGCVLKRIAFAGDDQCGEDELAYVNELREANEPETPEFTQAIVFSSDFHTPSEEQAEGTAWEPDTDYNDWTWHLGRVDDESAWHLMTWGYA